MSVDRPWRSDAALRRKGYPLAAIAAKLEAQGGAVSAIALQKTLREHRKTSRSKKSAETMPRRA